MKLNTLQKITNGMKLARRLPALGNTLAYAQGKVKILPEGSKMYEVYKAKVERTTKKINYIITTLEQKIQAIPSAKREDYSNQIAKASKMEFTASTGNKVKYPSKVSPYGRGSGYSSRDLGVSPRNLRANNFDPLKLSELKDYIVQLVKANTSPDDIRVLLFMEFDIS